MRRGAAWSYSFYFQLFAGCRNVWMCIGVERVGDETGRIGEGVGEGKKGVLAGGISEHASLFVGLWVAPFLLLGIYNKMVKQHGSDATVR
jgi:hypothetical protein